MPPQTEETLEERRERKRESKRAEREHFRQMISRLEELVNGGDKAPLCPACCMMPPCCMMALNMTLSLVGTQVLGQKQHARSKSKNVHQLDVGLLQDIIQAVKAVGSCAPPTCN